MNNVYCGDYIRITKTKAKQIYKKQDVYICACNLNPSSPFNALSKVDKNEDFDLFQDYYSAYNCLNAETGRYPSFYVKVRKNDK